MGNYRFRLSDMIPNAWFYKLKDMNKPFKNTNSSQNPNKKKSSPPSNTTTTTQLQPQHFSNPRHSYYFTTDPFKAEKLYNSPKNTKISDTHFPEPPRKSSKRSRRPSTKTKKTLPPKLVTSTVWPNHLDSTSEHSDHHSLFDSSPDSNFYEFLLRKSDAGRISGTDPFDSLTSWSSSCSCRISSSTADIIIDMDGKESFSRKFDGFDSIPELELPPILTKPAKFSDMVSEIKKKEKFRSSTKLEQRKTSTTSTTNKTNGSLSVKVVKEQKNTNSSIRKTSVGSPGVKIRSYSPKIASKKIQAYSRKSTSSNTTITSSKTSKKSKNVTDSFAIVKSSFDPQRDFRESMVEMIVENNIRASKDLEELLACYLSLNSNEYHDLIIKVFEQIWFDLTNFRL